MSTSEDAAVGTSDFIGHDTSGKYLLFKVPSYEDSGTNLYQAAKDTYLNLGRGMGGSGTASPGWAATSGNPATPNWTAEGLKATALTTARNSGEDLLAFFGGFADDTRLRSTGGTFSGLGTPPNESAARAAAAYSAPTATPSTSGTGRNLMASQLIPEYVGWRDHTDGHRITTTRGDKIEIIGGNYKIVSLGRGQGVATYELSGGIALAADEAPGATTSVTWRPLPTDTASSGWKVVEQVVKSNAVSRVHGFKREEFYGSAIISVIGSPDESTSDLSVDDAKNGDPEEYIGGTAATAEKNVATWEGESLDSYAYPTKWDQGGDEPPKLQRPAIYESTWAASIKEFKRVSGSFHSQEHFQGTHNERVIYDEGHKTETTMHGAGKYFQEVWHFLGSGGFLERFEGSFLQIFTGSSTTLGLANRFELYVSVEEQLNLGLVTSLSLGAKIDGSFPTKMQVDLTEDKVALEAAATRLNTIEADIGRQSARLDDVKTVLSDKRLALSRQSKALVTSL